MLASHTRRGLDDTDGRRVLRRDVRGRDMSRLGRTARVPAEAGTGTVEPTVSAGGRPPDAFRGKAGESGLRKKLRKMS